MRMASLLLVAAIAACADDEPPPPEPEARGRAETRSIRNTEAIGYSGDAIADKLDASLEAQEEAERRRRAQAEQQADGAGEAAP